MRKVFLIAVSACFMLTSTVWAQDEAEADSTLGWYKGALVGLNFNQVALSNWVGGGQSAWGLNAFFTGYSRYKTNKSIWENFLDMRIGYNRRGDEGTQKTDDKIEWASKYGYKIAKKWYASSALNFRTQFAPGFNYPRDDTQRRISEFMAPGYLQWSIGIEYKPADFFFVYLSPIASKFTFVTNDRLAADGAFGVDPGENVRSEFGATLRATFNKEIATNVTLISRLELFSNYAENPQNVDVFWETLLNMKVNNWLAANVSITMIYDDDIDIDKDGDGELDGPGLQFREALGIGLTFNLGQALPEE